MEYEEYKKSVDSSRTVVGSDFHRAVIPSTEELCKGIQEKLEYLFRKMYHLQTEKDKLESHVWEDEKMRYLKETNEKITQDMLRGFPITEEEEAKIKEWKTNHWKKHKSHHSFVYEFTPTPIGTVGKIICSKCGREFTFQESD